MGTSRFSSSCQFWTTIRLGGASASPTTRCVWGRRRRTGLRLTSDTALMLPIALQKTKLMIGNLEGQKLTEGLLD